MIGRIMRSLSRPFGGRLRGNRSGNTLVEFAIGSTILVAAFTGTFQFGYTFYRYNTLVNSVNAGARWASLAPYDSLTGTPSNAYQTKVKNIVVYGNPAGTGDPLLPGLQTSNVNVSMEMFGATEEDDVPYAVTVKINGYTINAIFGDMVCNNKPIVRYAYQGIYSPYAAGA